MEAAAAAAACSAKQRGKHICGRNQREGRLTTRVCRGTKPAHKHGNYASARERRAPGERNNAINHTSSGTQTRERLSRSCQLEGRTPCWGRCHSGAPSAPLFHLKVGGGVSGSKFPSPLHLYWPRSAVVAASPGENLFTLHSNAMATAQERGSGHLARGQGGFLMAGI